MAKLIIIRHGESVWNLQNRFTGWVDVQLSEKGHTEADNAGIAIKDYKFDKIYVSHLMRALQTMNHILRQSTDNRTPIIYHEDDELMKEREKRTSDPTQELAIYSTKLLAERYYGQLQGLNKKETADKYGAEQVQIWRRSFDVQPPGGESLKDTLARVLPYFEKTILQDLKEDKTILIVAHGNSLRAIVKYIEKLTDQEIPLREIATGVPILYELDTNLNIISKTELK